MAEFKLGRIRFVWKNVWTTATQYFQDDVIAYGGKVYICVIGHISAGTFFTDFNINPPKWNLVSDGQTWKGDWQPQVEYIFDDIVIKTIKAALGAGQYVGGDNFRFIVAMDVNSITDALAYVSAPTSG